MGLLVVVVSFLRRLQLGLLNSYYFNTAFTMSISSIAGSYLGAHLTDRIPEKELKSVLAVYLVVVGLKIITEPFFEASLSLTFAKDFVKETVLAALIGLAIGIISGHFGVAGGEFRIPALVYIFGLDIVDAGTVSLLVSIPTVGSSFLKHFKMGHMDERAKNIATAMGIGSIIGALAGASHVLAVDKEALKIILGIILLLSATGIASKSFRSLKPYSEDKKSNSTSQRASRSVVPSVFNLCAQLTRFLKLKASEFVKLYASSVLMYYVSTRSRH